MAARTTQTSSNQTSAKKTAAKKTAVKTPAAKKAAAKKTAVKKTTTAKPRAAKKTAAEPKPIELTRRMVAATVDACESKKGEDIRVLELDPADAGFTDFFVIATGANERQTQTIADEVELRLKREFHTYPNSVEGKRVGEWILLDYVDFVVHIFLREKRAFYDIERLRKSARAVDPAELTSALKQKTATARKRVAARTSAAL